MVRKFIILAFAIALVGPGTVTFAAVGVPRAPRSTPSPRTTPRPRELPPVKKAEFINFPNNEMELHRPRTPRTRGRTSRPTPNPTPQPESIPTPTPTSSPTPAPTPPPASGPESSCPNPATCNEFGLTGLYWSDPNGADNQGLPYYINSDDSGSLTDQQIQTTLTSSFGVWEQGNTSKRLRYRRIGSTNQQAGMQDFQNSISFFNFNRIRRYRGALAVTSLWYRPDTGEIIEFDIAFNNSVPWSINAWPIGCSEYPIDTCTGDSASYDFASVAVHEIGHTVMLLDLRKSNQREMTMYGSAKRGELKKRTLGLGDRTGLNLLYP